MDLTDEACMTTMVPNLDCEIAEEIGSPTGPSPKNWKLSSLNSICLESLRSIVLGSHGGFKYEGAKF